MTTKVGVDGSAVNDQWMSCMRRGDFEAAWRISDAVLDDHMLRRADVPRHHQIVWTGESLHDRRVLIRCYHGLGDTIQFIRYLPKVEQIARAVAVWAPPPLLPVIRSMGTGAELLPLHDGVPDWDYDVDVEVMELPHVFRTTVDTIPNDVPYLLDHEPCRVNDARAESLTRNVGLVWHATAWAGERSMPAGCLAPLWSIPNVDWHVLQERSEPLPWTSARIHSNTATNLLALARAISGLELVITVDTMVAHLAGALAVPVWTMLPEPADWRWMSGRGDSPWYPTMRLIRQQRPGDWPSVIESARDALAAGIVDDAVVESK